MKLKLSILIMIGLVIVGCKQEEEVAESQSSGDHPAVAAMANTHKGVVKEVIQTSEYTYLNVQDGDSMTWIAVTKREIEEGTTIGYTPELEMKNFTSKELSRTFDSILFLGSISTGDDVAAVAPSSTDPHQAMPGMTKQTKPVVGKQEVVIDPVEGGISIAQLYGDTATHGGQSVKIRGKVTKVNMGILGKNWIHIQDGTEAEGNYDLTVTTLETAKVGDVVVVEGKITLDKDFGSGYQYDVIMEDAHCHAE
jgi:hypothetical protein